MRSASIALAVLACGSAAYQARGGIYWTSGITLSGDSDVLNGGTAVYAYDLTNSSQTVNGVTFTGSNSTSALGTNVTISGLGGNYPGFGTSAPLSTAYKTVIAGGDYGSTAAGTITLNNLVAGHLYATQFWVDDSRAAFLGRTETLTSSGGNSQSLAYTNSNSAGGLGQYALGYFIAGGTTQAFTATGNASSQMNALSLRDITSTAWSGAASSNLGGTDGNFNGGTNYATANFSNFLTFADTDGAGNAVTNSTLNPVSGAVTSGVLNFISNTVAYTVNGGLAGPSVSVAGAKNVTFNGASTVNALAMQNTGGAVVAGTLTASAIQFASTSAAVSSSGSGAISIPAGGLAISSSVGPSRSGVAQTLSAQITGSGPVSIASMGDTSNSGGGNSSIFYLNNAANNFTGNVTITSGLVDSGANDTPFGASTNVIILNGGGLLANGNTTYASSRAIQLAGTGYFRAYGSATFTVPGAISGTGSLVKTDGGILVLNNQNTYAGGTQLPLGTISIGSNSTPTSGTVTSGPLGTGSVTLSGGALSTTAAVTIANPIVVSGTSNVFASASGNLTLNGAITGAGTFQNNTSVADTVFVQGDISGFTGTFSYTDVNTGNNLAFTGTTAASVNGAGAKFSVNGVTTSLRSIELGSASQTTFQMGELSGAGGIIGPAISSAPVTLQVGALNTSPAAFAGVLSDTSGFQGSGTGAQLKLTKVGSGTLTLSGASTYTGATTVSAGALNITGSLGTTPVAVNGATAVFQGTGTVAGPVSVLLGTMTPGSSTAIGKFTNSSTNSTAALDFSGGGTYLWKLGTLTDDTSGTAGVDFDQIALTGNGGKLVLGGISQLTLSFLNSIADPNSSDPFWQSNHSWTIISGAAGTTSNGASFASITNNAWADGSFSTAPGANGSETLTFTTSVPEPASAALLLLSATGLLARRRRA